jgi:hypothetical protein
LLGGFEHDGVAAGQRWAEPGIASCQLPDSFSLTKCVDPRLVLLPSRHTQWIIPRDNLCYNADGLAEGVGEFLVGGADGLAEDFVGPAGVVAEGGDGFGQVFGEGDGVWFAWELMLALLVLML